MCILIVGRDLKNKGFSFRKRETVFKVDAVPTTGINNPLNWTFRKGDGQKGTCFSLNYFLILSVS